MGLALISAHSWRVVLEMKNFLGAGGVGMGKWHGSGMVGEAGGEGCLRGERLEMGLVWDGPTWVSTITSTAVSNSDWSWPISPDSEG